MLILIYAYNCVAPLIYSLISVLILIPFFSAPTIVHGARISGLEMRMNQVEDCLCDLDARGSEEADNLANDHDLDRFILTGD